MDNKTPEMQAFLNAFTRSVYGRERSKCIKEAVCVTCGGPAKNFRDPLSHKEFEISGMCQKCQNEVFG
ncbi:MAG: hypothetical protein MN733_41555 [Nitrososphaera sp.]|nr:hypothetical protein [Nitrososphaera sp.]